MIEIKPVYQLNYDVLNTTSGIILINADKSPPHLGFFSNSKYYSLTVKDNQIGISIEVILQYIHRKRIPSIFISLKNKIENTEIEKAFQNYLKLDEQITCLQPIKEIFRNKITDLDRVNFIFELIPLLKEQGWVKSYYQLYAKEIIQDSSFSLRTYTMEDIFKRIKSLSK